MSMYIEYTTLAKLKTFLWITDTEQDTELSALIEQGSMLLDNELGWNIGKQTITKRIDGSGEARIILENKPNSVSSVKDAATQTAYTVDFIQENIVYLTTNTERGTKNIEITYEKGYDAVPADLERFFLTYCREILNMQSTSDTEVVKTQSLGGGLSLTYFSPSELAGRMVNLQNVITKYKNIVIC